MCLATRTAAMGLIKLAELGLKRNYHNTQRVTLFKNISSETARVTVPWCNVQAVGKLFSLPEGWRRRSCWGTSTWRRAWLQERKRLESQTPGSASEAPRLHPCPPRSGYCQRRSGTVGLASGKHPEEMQTVKTEMQQMLYSIEKKKYSFIFNQLLPWTVWTWVTRLHCLSGIQKASPTSIRWIDMLE